MGYSGGFEIARVRDSGGFEIAGFKIVGDLR